MPFVDPDSLPQAGGKFVDPDDIRSASGEIGAAAKRGLYQGVTQIGGALQTPAERLGMEPGIVSRAGKAVEEYGKAGAERNAPQETLHGPVTNFASQAAEGLTSFAPTLAAQAGVGAAVGSVAGPVGTVVGGALGAGGFTAGQVWHEEYQKALAADKSPDAARDHADKSAELQGGLMAGAGGVAGGVAKGAGIVGKALGYGAKDAAEAGTKAIGKKFGPEFAKGAAETTAVNTGATVGGAAGQAAIDSGDNLNTESPGDAALHAVMPALGASVGFLPLAALGAHTNVSHAKMVASVLANPNAAPKARAGAVKQVFDAMQKANPEQANTWALNAGEALHARAPIGVDSSWTEGLHPSVFPELAEPAKEPLALPAPGQVAIPADQRDFGPFEQSNEADQAAIERDAARSKYEAEQATLRGDPLTAAAFAGRASGAVDAKAAERAAEIPAAEVEEQKPTGDAGTDQSNMNIRSALGNQPQLSLADAQAKIAAINGSGESPNNYSVVPHPKGGYGIVPDHFITPQVKELYAGLQSRGTPERAPNLTPFDLERAQAHAEDLTSQSGVEHEVVPHPYARDKFLVQEKDAFTSREQPREVLQEQGAGGVLQREPGEAGVRGGERGRVEPVVQGEEAARQGEAARVEEGPATGVQQDVARHGVKLPEVPAKTNMASDGYIGITKPEDARAVSSLIDASVAAGHSPELFRGAGIIKNQKNDPYSAPMAAFAHNKLISIHESVLGDDAAQRPHQLAHEGGHLIDANPATGGMHSNEHPAFRIKTNADGSREAEGGIMKAAVAAFQNTNSLTGNSLSYPLRDFNRKDFKRQGYDSAHQMSQVLENEVFAQLSRMYGENPTAMMYEHPEAYALFKEMHDGTKKSSGIAGLERSLRGALQRRDQTGRVRQGEPAGDGRAAEAGAGDRGADNGVARVSNESRKPLAVDEGEHGGTADRGGAGKPATREDFKPGRVGDLLNKKDWAVLSAENPDAKPAAPAANKAATARLEADLKRLGVDYQPVRGKYGGPEENSFAVTGITPEQARTLRDLYGQDSILTNKGFEHKDGSITPAKSIAAKAPDEADYYTQMPDGTKWAADMDWDARTAPTRPLAVRDGTVKRGADSAIAIREGAEIRGLPRYAGLPDIARALNNLAPKRSYDKVADIKSATKQLFSEIAYQLKQAKSGLGWYAGDVQKAWRWAAQEHPELAHDPIKRQLVSIITGLHSPSIKARKNFTYGLIQYEHYKENGQFSPIIDPTTGQRWSGKPAHEQAITHVNQMLADTARWDGDPEHGVVQWLLTEHPKSVLAAERARYGVWAREQKGAESSDPGAWLDSVPHTADLSDKELGINANKSPGDVGFKSPSLKVGEDKELYLGTEMFGPKVGPFIGNLNGMNTHITVDVWATRTLRRLFGTLPTKVSEDGGIEGEGPTPQERNIVTMMLRQAAHDPELQKLGIKNGPDAQGVTWFFEQQLYDTITKGTESGFFSDGARDYVESKGHIVDEQGAGAPTLTDASVHARPSEDEANAAAQRIAAERPLYTDKPRKTDVFFSALSRAVDEKAPFAKDGTANAQMLRNWLDARTKDGTIKRDELQWTGLDDYLKLRDGKITRDEVNQFLDHNGVKVTETMLNDSSGREAAERARRLHNVYAEAGNRVAHLKQMIAPGSPYAKSMRDEATQKLPEAESALVEARANLDKSAAEAKTTIDSNNPTRYADRVLPGGKNYRELLLTLPGGSEATKKFEVYDQGTGEVVGTYTSEAAAEAHANRVGNYAVDSVRVNGAGFQSSHFTQPNILAHIRFNERTDANGKKVLFIEEIQSDWAQKGRKEGFDSPAKTIEQQAELRKQRDVLVEKLDDLKEGTPQHGEVIAHIRQLNEEIQNTQAYKKGVPNAPFVGKTEAWVALALKRMIRYAADNGFDRVAWTTGEQQASRGDLSKQVEAVRATKAKDGTYDLAVAQSGSRGRFEVLADGIKESDIETHVGKDLAKKIVERGGGTYKGVDLAVGGEGMKSFYDKIVPNVANDVLKKLGGGRVEDVAVDTGDRVIDARPGKNSDEVVEHSRQQGFDITPAMKDKVVGGQPLFVREDGTKATDKSVLPPITGGKAADSEARFDKNGEVLHEEGTEPHVFDPKHLEPWMRGLTHDQIETLRKAGGVVETKPIREKVKELKHEAGLRVIQATTDQFASIQSKLGDIPYKLARMASAYDAGIETLLHFGQIKLNSFGAIERVANTKGLLEILKPLQGEASRYYMWKAGLRADRLSKEDLEHNFHGADIATLKSLNTKMHATDNLPGGADGSGRAAIYAAVLKEDMALQKAMLDLGDKAGILDPEMKKIFENQIYVPFFRTLEDGESNVKFGNTSGMVNQYFSKRLKGGTEPLGDLMQNTIQNYSHIVQASLKNNAATKILEAAEKKGLALEATASDKGAVYVLADGKQKWYTVQDHLLFDSISALEQSPFKVPKSLAWMKHMLTVGTTLSPIFRMRHTIREQIASLILGHGSYNPVKNWVDGFKYSSRNNPEYGNMMAGGSFFRMGYSYEDNRAAYFKQVLAHGIDTSTILDTPGKVKEAFAKSWDWWKETGERSDSITRANRYRNTYAEMIAAGKGAEEAHFEASYAARSTLDYGLHGTMPAIKMITGVVPFMNARIQGLYVIGKAAHADPVRFATVIGGVTMATMALSLAYRDDKEMQAREEWDRDSNWAFRLGGKMVRIPKPFELGAIATVADRALETALNGFNKSDRERFVERLWPIIGSQLNLNPIASPAIAVPIQLWGNKDWFTGRRIETEREQNLTPGERFGIHTSQTARGISGAMGGILKAVPLVSEHQANEATLSPEQIDFAVNALFGWVGAHAIMTADLALRPMVGAPNRPAPRIDEVPVLGDFIKTLGTQSRDTEAFYKHLTDVQQAMGDLRNAQKTGQFEKAVELAKSSKNQMALNGMYNATTKQLGILGQRERWTNMRNMDPDDKRVELDRIAQQKNMLTERAERARAAIENRPQ